MTKKQLLQATGLDNKIQNIEDMILELEEYQRLLESKPIKNIKITYEAESACNLIYNLITEENVPVKRVHEMNEKWLNELKEEQKNLLKEFEKI